MIEIICWKVELKQEKNDKKYYVKFEKWWDARWKDRGEDF